MRAILRPTARLNISGTFLRFSSTMQPSFSAGTDTARVTPALEPLLSTEGGRWALTNEGEALERTFRFKTFAKTWVSDTRGRQWLSILRDED